jgi:hypothetical protein
MTIRIYVASAAAGRYAVALGRADAAQYQRLSATHSSGMGMEKARVAKSTVTSMVMSAGVRAGDLHIAKCPQP